MGYTVHGILQARILEWVAFPFSRGSSQSRELIQVSHIAGGFFTNLDSILKSIDITLPTKVLLVKATVFPVVMYGYESWTIKKVEYQRIDAFELWCWRRLLRVPWTARRSNQSILKEISPEYSVEGLMLKLQYFGYLMRRTDLLEKTLLLGKIDSRRRRGQQRIKRLSLTQWTWAWASSGSWWWTGKPGMLQSMGSQRVGHDWVAELNWTMEYVLCRAVPSHLWLFVTPWAVALQAPLSMEFSRQEYWSGLPFPPAGNLPNAEVKLTSLVSSALSRWILYQLCRRNIEHR